LARGDEVRVILKPLKAKAASRYFFLLEQVSGPFRDFP
jgi:hypothetical protein